MPNSQKRNVPSTQRSSIPNSERFGKGKGRLRDNKKPKGQGKNTVRSFLGRRSQAR